MGRATALHEIDGVVQIDFDVRREDGRCVEVVAGPAERVESPREDVGCLVDLEPFELCRRHSLPLSRGSSAVGDPRLPWL